MSLVWITDPLALLAERAARAGKARLDQPGRPSHERFLRPRLFEADLTRLGSNIRSLTVNELGDRVEAFWRDLAAEGRPTARRDVAALRWRMSNPDRTRDPILLAWMDGEQIGGLLLAEISKITQIDAPTLEIIDVVALRDCTNHAIPELVKALLRNASRLGCARVRIPVVTPEMALGLAGVPGAHKRRGHTHGYVLARAGTEALIEDWRMTPYDGEFGFSLRFPPRPDESRRAA